MIKVAISYARTGACEAMNIRRFQQFLERLSVRMNYHQLP